MDFRPATWTLAVILTAGPATETAAAAAPGATAPATRPAASQPASAEDEPVGPTGADESLPLGRDGPSAVLGLGRTVAALAVVAAMIVGIWLALRLLRTRSGMPGGGKGLDVLARTPLSPKHQLFLVRWGDRELLIGAGPEGLTTLAQATKTDEEQAQTESKP